jgi:hypothetical protein
MNEKVGRVTWKKGGNRSLKMEAAGSFETLVTVYNSR